MFQRFVTACGVGLLPVLSICATEPKEALFEKQFTKPSTTFHLRVKDLVDVKQLPNWRYYTCFVSSLNFRTKTPNVVIEPLPGGACERRAGDRGLSHFTGNHLSVLQVFQVKNDDYKGSGYTRGHMAAAGNFECISQLCMNESFLLNANIVPQEARNNSGFWLRMEMFTRELLPKVGGEGYVLSGPLYLPHTETVDPDANLSHFRVPGAKQYVTNEVLGSGVHVPTHLFKVVVVFKDGIAAASAFVVKNDPVENLRTITDCEVPLAELEKNVGFQILPSIPREKVKPLCKGLVDCDAFFPSIQHWHSSLLKKRIKSARDRKDLMHIWTGAQKFAESNGFKLDSKDEELYQKKMGDLQ